jgi:hypothetical protein
VPELPLDEGRLRGQIAQRSNRASPVTPAGELGQCGGKRGVVHADNRVAQESVGQVVGGLVWTEPAGAVAGTFEGRRKLGGTNQD